MGSCALCQEYKRSQQPPAGKMFWSRLHSPWETVSSDLIGPLTRSSLGNKYLLVFQDRFTKWIEVQPLRNATARTVIQGLRKQIIYRYGTPKTIVSDNGAQYSNRLFKKMTTAFGIHHRFTPPYSPQNNPVERANKVIGTIIAQLAKGDQKKWDAWLLEMVFALNSAKHESTGFTPAMLNFGRELLPPKSVRAGVDPERHPDEEESPHEYREHMRKLEDVISIARTNLEKAFIKQSHHYNMRRRAYQPRVGNLVYRREHVLSDTSKGFMANLAPKFAGPFRIARVESPVIVEIRNLDNNRFCGRVHVKDLKVAHEIEDNDGGEKGVAVLHPYSQSDMEVSCEDTSVTNSLNLHNAVKQL